MSVSQNRLVNVCLRRTHSDKQGFRTSYPFLGAIKWSLSGETDKKVAQDLQKLESASLSNWQAKKN